MNLFLETPQQAAERLMRGQGCRTAPSGDSGMGSRSVFTPAAAGAPDAGSRPAAPASPPGMPAGNRVQDGCSIAQEAYREEIAYGRRRARLRKRAAALRVIATMVLVPVVLLLAFIASYVLTCIINGASPDDIAGLLSELWGRLCAWIGGGPFSG